MKILYIFEGSYITDSTIWSGTVSRLYRTLSINNTIIPISISSKVLLIQKIARKILSKLNMKSEFKFLYKLNFLLLKRKIAKLEFDYIFAPVMSGILAYLNIDKPIIYLTDATHHLMNGYYYKKNNFDMKILNFLEYNSLKNATYIIAASNWAKSDMINFYRINPEKIFFIPFYTSLNDYYKIKQHKKNKEYIFLFVGVDWNRKGIQTTFKPLRQSAKCAWMKRQAPSL